MGSSAGWISWKRTPYRGPHVPARIRTSSACRALIPPILLRSPHCLVVEPVDDVICDRAALTERRGDDVGPRAAQAHEHLSARRPQAVAGRVPRCSWSWLLSMQPATLGSDIGRGVAKGVAGSSRLWHAWTMTPDGGRTAEPCLARTRARERPSAAAPAPAVQRHGPGRLAYLAPPEALRGNLVSTPPAEPSDSCGLWSCVGDRHRLDDAPDRRSRRMRVFAVLDSAADS